MSNPEPTDEQINLIASYLEQQWDNHNPKFGKWSTYPVKDFYDASKVEQALGQIGDIQDATYTQKEYKEYKDYYGRVHGKLTANPEALLKHISDLMSIGKLELKEYTYLQPDKETAKRLALKYTELSSEYEVNPKLLDPKDTENKTVIAKEYSITDPDALGKELEQANLLKSTTYLLSIPEAKFVTTTIGDKEVGISRVKQEAGKLAGKLELDTDNKLKNLYYLYASIEIVVATVLAEMRKKGSATRYPNLKGEGVGIPKAVIDAGTEGFTRTKENPELLQSLDKVYRNEQERTDSEGLAIQTVLFKGLTSGESDTDIAPWATVDGAIRALNIAGTTALVACIRYLHENPNGGDINIADLMAYDHKYKEQKETRRGLKKDDKTTFANSLKLLLALNWAIKTKSSDRTSTIKYYRLVGGAIEVNNDTGEIIRVKGLKFDKDFYDIKNNLLYVLAPKGIDYLSSPEAKSVALKVQSLFAKHQKDTIAGKPQEISRDWLAKGSYKINSRTNEIIIKLLNEMVEHTLIDKWCNKKGTQTLSGYDKDTYKILLYPTKEAQESYITKEQRTAERKAEQQLQKLALSNLKKAIKNYGTKDELANHLGTTSDQLDSVSYTHLTLPTSDLV